MTQVQESIASLQQAVATPLDRNDLGRLAQMHSWGQLLAEADAATGDAAATNVLRRLATALVGLLERLILDEAADPATGLALVPQIVTLASQAAAGQAVECDALLAQISAALEGGAPAATPPPDSVAPAVPAPAVPPSPVAQVTPAQAPVPPPTAAPSARPANAPAATVDEAYVAEPLVLDMDEREHLDGFLEEATEHMDNIETGLLEVENNPSDTNKLNELFRPFHTIKGIAGFLNLRDINRLTHEIETILDAGRKGSLQITTGMVDLIFAAVDVLKSQLAAIRQYLAAPTGGPCPQPNIVEIMARLRRAAAGQPVTETVAPARPRLGELLVAGGDATPADVAAALTAQSSEPAPQRKLGEILVDQGAASEDQVKRALAQQQDTSIRVDTGKLDALVDAVGELVIAQSMVSLTEAVHEDEKLLRNVSQVSKIVRDVQEIAMGMRMVPIGHTFQKMRRLVRDVSRKAGKVVELRISGEETELDKNVIQQISDPLVHLVRNAVDHGIEPPDERRRLGKPEQGDVQLNAYHQGDSIVIEIRDDGHGLDKDKLIAKGVEKGLVAPGEQLSEQQAFALILAPGFSTAEKVTDISGRGVGMDVVKRNVEQLRGKIEIHSQKGAGSCFMIRLPLTLAIIDGMLVRVGTERLIIPTILIEQSLQPEAKQLTSVQRRGVMLQVRGELCPLIQLGALFNYTEPVDPCGHLAVIVQCEGQKVALVVEELIGQQQVVIKTLGERFKNIKGVSGAAILGDGRVGLILEPSGLLALHNHMGCATYQAPPAGPPVSVPAAAVMAGADPDAEFPAVPGALDADTDSADEPLAAAVGAVGTTQ